VLAIPGLQAVKYLYKYVFKGPDRANIKIVHRRDNDTNALYYDEVEDYVEERFISPPSAIYKIFGYPMHGNHVSVTVLPIHLVHGQQIEFDPGKEAIATTLGANKKTPLMGWFDHNRFRTDGRTVLYADFPKRLCMKFDKSGVVETETVTRKNDWPNSGN
jgi:hypothetical protein